MTSPGQEGTTIVLHEKQELTVVPFHKMPLRGAAAVVTQQPASGEITRTCRSMVTDLSYLLAHFYYDMINSRLHSLIFVEKIRNFGSVFSGIMTHRL